MTHTNLSYDQIIHHIKNYAMSDIKQRISENLKRLRKGKGWKMRQVAAMIFVSTECYENYEYKRSAPSAEVLLRLSKLYNVTVDYLVSVNTADITV